MTNELLSECRLGRIATPADRISRVMGLGRYWLARPHCAEGESRMPRGLRIWRVENDENFIPATHILRLIGIRARRLVAVRRET